MPQGALYLARDVFDLRQDFALQFGVVGDPSVFSAGAADEGVQAVKQLAGDSGGDLRAVAERQAVLMRYDHTVRLRNGLLNGVPIVRMVANLSDADIENLAAYFSSMK